MNLLSCCNTKKDTYENILGNISIIDHNELPYFSFKNKKVIGKIVSVYDGDSFTAIFEYKGDLIKYKFRCYGYTSPELKPSLSLENRDEIIKLANDARNKFIELTSKSENKLVTLECFEFDNYGRILVNVYNNVDKESVNKLMIKEGYGVEFIYNK
jgi:endonuclease YncB( thermonuclease family)